METRFEEIIHNLSKKTNVDLVLDENNAVSILIDERLLLQMEADLETSRLLIFSPIANIAAGKFRENVLINAMKENDKYDFDFTFAYMEQDNSLTLFKYLRFKNINPELLTDVLAAFIDTALIWKDAIDAGRATPQEIISSGKEKPFNMK
jgi:hypothetical protein